MLLKETLNNIEPLSEKYINLAWHRIDNLTKPIGSLGKLEEIAAKVCGIKREVFPKIHKKNIIIMCADNGIIEENVSNCDKELTKTVTENFTKQITGVYTIGKFYGSSITVVDIGVDYNFNNERIINKKIMYGTKNSTKGPAMTRGQAVKAIESGIEIVDELCKEGYDLFGTGEMGVGNTSTSAAVLSVLLDMDSDSIVGKGSGINKEQFKCKKEAIKKSIKINKPNKKDPIDVISKVGGLDIAGLCGCFLGASKNKVPIVIDGFISAAAAICAYKLNPYCKDYMFPSHLSAEKGIKYAMKELNMEPYFNLNMRLGEGSGCPFTFNLIESSIYTMSHMGTFKDANVESENFIDLRKEEK